MEKVQKRTYCMHRPQTSNPKTREEKWKKEKRMGFSILKIAWRTHGYG